MFPLFKQLSSQPRQAFGENDRGKRARRRRSWRQMTVEHL
jgi:hypothetical protein